ncbi:MAG: tripartite tricarboxylate transporter TctB family protein [Phascolarctobacterium sp.]|nr:tripartite tricarboxylate transporter TctB family protein [Phascolarctobacterium sp.]
MMMNNMTICNYIVGIVGMVLGGLIMSAAAAFPLQFTENGPGPGFWPFSLGCALAVAALVLLIFTFTKRADLAQQKVNLTTAANKRVYIMMGLVVLFCVFINLLGFYPAAALLIIATMKLMDYHNKKEILLTTVLTLAFIYLVFGVLLHTKMPQSLFLS